jgi:Na+-transporting NADH:ubiquinone oxidoreductase subunit NqrC
MRTIFEIVVVSCICGILIICVATFAYALYDHIKEQENNRKYGRI